MDSRKHELVNRSRQSDRKEEAESKEAKPLTLEDYMNKASDEISRLLPSETEERFIAASVGKHKDLGTTKERKKIQIKSEKKLDVEETSPRSFNEEFEGMGKSPMEGEVYKQFSQPYDEYNSGSEGRDEMTPIKESSDESAELPKKSISVFQKNIAEEVKYKNEKGKGNGKDIKDKSKGQKENEGIALKNILDTELKLNMKKEIKQQIEYQNEDEDEEGSQHEESQEEDRSEEEEEEEVDESEEIYEKPEITIQRTSPQTVKEKDTRSISNMKKNEGNGKKSNLNEVDKNETLSKSRESSENSKSNNKFVPELKKTLKAVNKSTGNNIESVKQEDDNLEKNININKKKLTTEKELNSKAKETSLKQEIKQEKKIIKEIERNEDRDIKQDTGISLDKERKTERNKEKEVKLEKEVKESINEKESKQEKEIKRAKEPKSEKNKKTKPISKSAVENYYDKDAAIKVSSSEENEISEEKIRGVLSGKEKQIKFNAKEVKANNNEYFPNEYPEYEEPTSDYIEQAGKYQENLVNSKPTSNKKSNQLKHSVNAQKILMENERKEIKQESPKKINPILETRDLIQTKEIEAELKLGSHQRPPKSEIRAEPTNKGKSIEKTDQTCQTDPTSVEQSLQDKINHYEKIIKSQSKELEGMRGKLTIKSNEIQALTVINEKNTAKIQKLKKKVEKSSEEIKRLFDVSEEKDYYQSNLLRGKEEIIEPTRAAPAVLQKKKVISEADFWKLDDIEERNKVDFVSLRDIAKNKSLWISYMEEKKNPLDFSDKIHSKVPDPSITNKNYDYIKKFPTKSKLKHVRRSLEPLTPITLYKSQKDST